MKLKTEAVSAEVPPLSEPDDSSQNEPINRVT